MRKAAGGSGRPGGVMKFSMRTPDGSTFDIEVDPTSKVADVKKLIETTQGRNSYPADQQVLMHQGNVLKNDTTLEESKVLENSFIDITLSKVHDIPWHLTKLQQDHEKEQIQGMLMIPSPIPSSYKGAWIYPRVMLDLHAYDAKVIHGLNIMRNSTSRNILHASLIMKGAPRKGASRILSWVEPFAGSLQDYLMARNLGISEYKDSGSKIVLPTHILLSAVSECVDGIEDLRISGNYHGNFSFNKTYYAIEEKSSARVVKLCNFRKKEGGTYNKYLAEDWAALRAELKQLLEIAKRLMSKYPNLDCCQLEGLINAMRDINMSNAQTAFGLIKRQPFFWGKEERKSFFIYVIPIALSKAAFFSKVENEQLIILPWDKTNFHGFLELMNKFRRDNGLDEYDTESRIGLVKFVSGLYTHELQLKSKKKVDVVIKEDCPDLCYILYALLHIPRR